MKDFSNAFGGVQLQQQPQNTNYTPQQNIDYDAFNAKQKEVLGGIGKHSYIGVITNAYSLGTQEQDEQILPWNDSDTQKNHAWRLEKYDDGNAKDKTAKVELRWFKKQQQECLVFTPPPVDQFALVVDLPEVMMPYGEFFEGSSDKPYRIILGKEGFITKTKAEIAGTRNLIAKPFNLKHVNVNRGRDGVAPHYALAKNGKVVKIAGFAGVTDENGNFHAQDVGKLIGKVVNLEVDVTEQSWESNGKLNTKLVVNAEVTSRLSPRDQKYFDDELATKITDDMFGFVLFNAENDENTLKTLNVAVINTMKLSPDFKGSALERQLEALGKLGGGQNNASQQRTETKQQKPVETPVVEQKVVEEAVQTHQTPQSPAFNDDFNDDIPF